MNNRKIIKEIVTCSIVVLTAFALSAFVIIRTTPSVALGDAPTYIKTMNVSTGLSITTSSSDVLTASSGRIYAILVNDGSNPVYLSMNGAPAVANQGVRLNANGGSYEINSLNQYIGQINAITASGSSALTVSASQ